MDQHGRSRRGRALERQYHRMGTVRTTSLRVQDPGQDQYFPNGFGLSRFRRQSDQGLGRRRYPDFGSQNGLVLQQTIDVAVANAAATPEVDIQSVDELNEGTCIQPSLEYGFDRAFPIQTLAARFKGQTTDPAQVVAVTEDYLNEVYQGNIPANETNVLRQALGELDTVNQNIAAGVAEYQAKPHPFRASAGRLAGWISAGFSSMFLAVGFATLVSLPALGLVVPVLGFFFGGYLAIGAVQYWRVGRAVERAMFTFLTNTQKDLNLQTRRAFARQMAIAWSDGRTHAAMGILEAQNPWAARQVKFHETFKSELAGMLMMLPGIRYPVRFLVQAWTLAAWLLNQVVLGRFSAQQKKDLAQEARATRRLVV